ncbi:hypothetical protein FB45DRAFT_909983 [Roridomyces roridus]|uniref:Uncharacterized protein n=1 Tax=Roridomyces roridus TaxID=1738132 RepID=A0AAD7BZH4_9AGAR|nr:hypothetical protein FB45DRAFT_909983 [Roridomyces roridus]
MTSEASDANAQTGSEFELMSDKQSTTPQSVANSPPTADFPEVSLILLRVGLMLTFPRNQKKGGFLAWVTILGAWLALFSTFGYINAFGVYQGKFWLAGPGDESLTADKITTHDFT